ncbi:MAG TPA: hypothetical protein VN870_10490 [Streptosporangiaceae bacterium]|nr:hypothetical protein [Streptosporangiaceae bacterium]
MTNSRGLELGDMENVSGQEVSAFANFYNSVLGHRHIGLDLWLDTRPDVLKRYRQYSDTATPRTFEDDHRITGAGFTTFYAVVGYDVGVRYAVRMMQVAGLNRSQVYENLAICFLVGGPRGMETIALALRDYEWLEPTRPATFPDGWAHRPEFLRSGLDFSTREMLDGEMELLEDWYVRTLGEVPPYVELLLDLRPALLKAYRDRYENLLRELPTEFIPASLLHYDVIRGFGEGIRENVLLLRALGVSRDQVVNIAGSASLNGGMAGFSIMAEAAGDVLRDWGANR